MSRLWKAVRRILGSICIVDWFLMIFMLILFCYLVFHLFIIGSVSQDTGSIDVIVRTSIASIFGYFISSNFIRTDVSITTQNTDDPNIQLSSTSADTSPYHRTSAQIGFQTSMSSPSEELGKISFSENASIPTRPCKKTQIIVVSVIGLISLVLLFVIRYFQNITPESTATISQLRDFVSACIGFLISCGKNTTH